MMLLHNDVFKKIEGQIHMQRTIGYFKIPTKPILSRSPLILFFQKVYKDKKEIFLAYGLAQVLVASILLVFLLPEAAGVVAVVEVSEVGSAVATTALTGGNALTYLAGLRTVIAANEIIIKGLAAGAVLTISTYENTAEASEPTFGDSILWVISNTSTVWSTPYASSTSRQRV